MLSIWQLVYQIYLPSIVTEMAKESQILACPFALPWARMTFFISSLNLYYPWSLVRVMVTGQAIGLNSQ